MKLQKKPARRVIYFVVTVGLILLVIGGGYLVYAAMTATDKKENDFQVGQVQTEIVEDYDHDRTEIQLDESVTKDVTIKNNGTINQFIRVMVLPEVHADVPGDPNHKQVLSLTVGAGRDLELEQLNTNEWKDGGDGYYYYVKEAVAPNKSTTSLFKTIKLANSLSDQYHNGTFSLSLKVETINCNETAYRQAWWHGSTPTAQPLQAIDDALKTMTDN